MSSNDLSMGGKGARKEVCSAAVCGEGAGGWGMFDSREWSLSCMRLFLILKLRDTKRTCRCSRSVFFMMIWQTTPRWTPSFSSGGPGAVLSCQSTPTLETSRRFFNFKVYQTAQAPVCSSPPRLSKWSQSSSNIGTSKKTRVLSCKPSTWS